MYTFLLIPHCPLLPLRQIIMYRSWPLCNSCWTAVWTGSFLHIRAYASFLFSSLFVPLGFVLCCCRFRYLFYLLCVALSFLCGTRWPAKRAVVAGWLAGTGHHPYHCMLPLSLLVCYMMFLTCKAYINKLFRCIQAPGESRTA